MKKHYLLAFVAAIALAGCENDNYINDEGKLVPKTVVDDTSLPSITVNGTQLHAEAFGNPNDPMVVFLHGGPGSDYRNAFPLKDLTEEGYYVVFFDQRGAGLSERHPYGSYSIQQAFDDLGAVIAHYKTSPSQKVFLFGHSWGAILAAGYINKYPGEIDGSIFAEAAALHGMRFLSMQREQRRSITWRKTATTPYTWINS
ncbi:MAG: alpha/beta fold hydrolase [Bacteroidota bacterium]